MARNHNVILKGKDETGKRFVSLHGEYYRIDEILAMNKRVGFLIRVESVITGAKTIADIERDKNYKVKFK